MSLAMQSIAASSSSACAAPEGVAHRRKDVEARPHGKERGEAVEAPKGRHALLAALTDALEGLDAAPAGTGTSAPSEEPSTSDRESRQALHAFVHELFSALRPAESEGRPGRGFAWGRTSASDFVQRLDALVQRLQGSVPASPQPTEAQPAPEAAAPAPAAAAATPPSAAPATASAATPAAEGSVGPTPRVAVDPLLSAFQQLIAARRPADGSGAASGDGTDALIAFLQRVVQALDGDAASGPPSPGTLLDVTA